MCSCLDASDGKCKSEQVYLSIKFMN